MNIKICGLLPCQTSEFIDIQRVAKSVS